MPTGRPLSCARALFHSALLVTAFVYLLQAAAAQALAARTFVSAAGSDSNNCSNVATPCRHFAAAYAATAPNGEIYVLDPANYGALTITGPVSIEGHGWASVAPVSGSASNHHQRGGHDRQDQYHRGGARRDRHRKHHRHPVQLRRQFDRSRQRDPKFYQ